MAERKRFRDEGVETAGGMGQEVSRGLGIKVWKHRVMKYKYLKNFEVQE